MIYVRMELWPSSQKDKAKLLGEAYIANTGEGNTDVGEYQVELMKSPAYSKKPGIWKRGFVKGFKRLKYGPWDLLFLALIAALKPERVVEVSKGISIDKDESEDLI